ncbi:MAG: class I SAM-dependent methyltransferase [Verrucomicrobia bacterium]|nr:class I SAM-dependent methyltransferase [Verrucomicrobiota bacterium]
MTAPAPTPTRKQLHQIAALCPQRWVQHYTRSKLSSDPVYGAVANEVIGTTEPLLDIGCGIGLLAHYLHVCGHHVPVTGFDYDQRKIDSAISMATSAGHSHLSFAAGDARTGLPEFSGHVVILDILQFFTEEEQDALLTAAASRVASGAKLIIRSGIRDDSGRFRITVLGDYLAKACFWMKAAPTRYPDAAQFQRVLTAAGLKVSIQPMWGGTPFNNFLIVGQR